MKNLTLIIGLLLSSSLLFAQTNATDFTANDCSGTEHNLFSELEEGKVVVLAWVMPCGACIPDPLAAQAIVNSYSESHPGRVLFYLADDYANTNCPTLMNWAANNGMGDATTFANAAVDMGDYGQAGMPKIVVLAGQDHLVYFNENSSTTGLSDAIDLALAETPLSVSEVEDNMLQLFPNPANTQLTIQMETKGAVRIVDALGKLIAVVELNAGEQQTIEVADWAKGVYFAKVATESAEVVQRFVVSQ